jgi:hypothetical protein
MTEALCDSADEHDGDVSPASRMGQVLVTKNEGERTAVEAREDERVRGGVMGSEAIQTQVHRVRQVGEDPGSGKSDHNDDAAFTTGSRFLPVAEEALFCGIAKKLGCQFCAPK